MTASQLEIDGYGYGATEISSSAERGSRGDAGSVNVTADNLTLINGGTIESSTDGPGKGGEVIVDAGQLVIDAQGGGTFTGIDSSVQVHGTGDAGQVTVTADDLQVLNGGEIRSVTWGQGNAGVVRVNAKDLNIDGQGYEGFTGINSSAASGSDGEAGSVTIMVDGAATLANGAEISTSTAGQGSAGDIELTAAAMDFSGSTISSSSTLENVEAGSAGSITLDTTSGRGGITLDDMLLDTSVQGGQVGAGDAANISVNSGGVLTLRNGTTVTATTTGAPLPATSS